MSLNHLFFSEITPWLFKISASLCRKWREDGIIDSIAMCLAVISVAGNKIANNIDMPIFWKVTNKFCLDSFESVSGIINICPSLSTASKINGVIDGLGHAHIATSKSFSVGLIVYDLNMVAIHQMTKIVLFWNCEYFVRDSQSVRVNWL